jgi:hypothetical protein
MINQTMSNKKTKILFLKTPDKGRRSFAAVKAVRI